MANPKNLKKSKEIGRSDILFCLTRIPDSGKLVLGSSDFNLYSLDPTAEKTEPEKWEGHKSYVTAIVRNSDALISASYDRKLIWWKPNGEKIRALPAHEKWIRNLAISSDGNKLASVADDMVCKIWNAKDGSVIHECRAHETNTPHHFPSMLYACAFSPDDRYVASGDRTGIVHIWDVETGEPISKLEAPTMYTWDPKARIHSIGGIRSLAFSPDGKRLAVGGMGQVGNIDHLGGKTRVEIFDWKSQDQICMLEHSEYKGLTERLIYSSDSKWLLAAGGDHGGFVMMLNPETCEVIKQEKTPTHIHDAIVTADTIYTAAHNKIVLFSIA